MYTLPSIIADRLPPLDPVPPASSTDPNGCPSADGDPTLCLCGDSKGAWQCRRPMDRANAVWNVFVALMTPILEEDARAGRIPAGTHRMRYLKDRYKDHYARFRDSVLGRDPKDTNRVNAVLCDVVRRYVGPRVLDDGAVVGKDLRRCGRPTKRNRSRAAAATSQPPPPAPRAGAARPPPPPTPVVRPQPRYVHERVRSLGSNLWEAAFAPRIASHVKERMADMSPADIIAVVHRLDEVFLRGFLGRRQGFGAPLTVRRIHREEEGEEENDPDNVVVYDTADDPGPVFVVDVNVRAMDRILARGHGVRVDGIEVRPSPFRGVPPAVLWLCVGILGCLVDRHHPDTDFALVMHTAFGLTVEGGADVSDEDADEDEDEDPTVRPTVPNK